MVMQRLWLHSGHVRNSYIGSVQAQVRYQNSSSRMKSDLSRLILEVLGFIKLVTRVLKKHD